MTKKRMKIVGHSSSREQQVATIAMLQIVLGALGAIYVVVTIESAIVMVVTLAVIAAQTAILYILLRAFAELIAIAKVSAGMPSGLASPKGEAVYQYVCGECEAAVSISADQCPHCEAAFSGTESALPHGNA